MHYSKHEQEMNDLKKDVGIIVEKKDEDILWLMRKTEVCTVSIYTLGLVR